MASASSYADVIGDWAGLLEAVERNAEVQPSLETERQTLALQLTTVQELKARQDELTALRQEVTQRLREELGLGRDVAMRVRAVAKGKLGPKSERLVHFRVAPLRKRSRKTVSVKQPDGEGTVAGASPSA